MNKLKILLLGFSVGISILSFVSSSELIYEELTDPIKLEFNKELEISSENLRLYISDYEREIYYIKFYSGVKSKIIALEIPGQQVRFILNKKHYALKYYSENSGYLRIQIFKAN